MLVCIPSGDDGGLDAAVSGHFGRAPTYTFYDTDTGEVEVVANRGKHRGGSEAPPVLVAREGAEVVLCSNLGQGAIRRFDAHGVAVFCGASGTVQDAVEQWQAGELDDASDESSPCGHEHGHGDGHGHEHTH